nr:MAG TPA: hypothetical protein [Caudoviricetes sp.]
MQEIIYRALNERKEGYIVQVIVVIMGGTYFGKPGYSKNPTW